MNKFKYIYFYETYDIANMVKAISFFIGCDIGPQPKPHWGQRKGFYWCLLFMIILVTFLIGVDREGEQEQVTISC